MVAWQVDASLWTEIIKTALPCNAVTALQFLVIVALRVFVHSYFLFSSKDSDTRLQGLGPETLPSSTTTKNNLDFIVGSGLSCLAPSSLRVSTTLLPFLHLPVNQSPSHMDSIS